MTAYKKIAVSLPLRAAEHVKREVKAGRAASVSAYIAKAIDEKAQRGSLRTLLDLMLEETGGPTTPAERRATERLLGYKSRRRPRKSR